MNIHIIGSGYVPADPRRAVSNQEVIDRILASKYTTKEDLSRVMKLTPDAVFNKIGVRSRQYFCNPDNLGDPKNIFPFELARIAAENAIIRAKQRDPHFSVDKIGLVISGGAAQDNVFPGCSTYLQDTLGIPGVECSDLSDACCTFTQGVATANRAMQCDDKIRYALVATGEVPGSVVNPFRNEDATLWGDGAAAFVLAQSKCEDGTGIVAYKAVSDGSLRGTTLSRGLGVAAIHREYEYLDNSLEGLGTKIYQWVLRFGGNQLVEFAKEHNCPPCHTYLVPHNGNLPMVLKLGEKIGLPPERVLNLVAERGNQSSAGAPSTFAYYEEQGLFKRGDKILFITFGAGLKMNLMLYIYS